VVKPEGQVDVMELILVRHATSVRAKTGIWGSLFDAPLEDGFESQLADTRSALASVGEATVFSSPLLRCRQTADFVCPHREVILVNEFRAYHSGRFEGKPVDMVRADCPGYFDLSYRERFLAPQFGEESIVVQAHRVGRGLIDVLRAGPRTAIVVAHFSTINVIAHLCSLNWDTDTYADGTYGLDEGAFIRVTAHPGAVVTGMKFQTGQIA
jgi:broad specificity phosphatase PhoE